MLLLRSRPVRTERPGLADFGLSVDDDVLVAAMLLIHAFTTQYVRREEEYADEEKLRGETADEEKKREMARWEEGRCVVVAFLLKSAGPRRRP